MPEDLCACDQREPIRQLTSTIVTSKRTGPAWGEQSTDDTKPATPNLAAWRAEAGTCAPLDAAATRDWRVDPRRPRSLITGGPIPISHIEASRVSHCGSDGTREITTAQGVADIAFIAAARTGWPRDATRVGVLCERVAALEAALGEALDGWDDCAPCVKSCDHATCASGQLARLRALAAGGAPAPAVAPDATEPCPGSRGW